MLQAQIRPSGDRSLLSPMLYWDERPFPWVDVVLTAEEMHLLNFHVNRTHAAMNVALAQNADDPASIGHARALVYTAAWLARKDSSLPHLV